MAYLEASKTVLTTNGDLRTRPGPNGGDDRLPHAGAGWGAGESAIGQERNTDGRAVAMTMLTRLHHGWGPPYLRLVLWVLRHLHPLTKARALSFIHFAHFAVLDGLAPGPAAEGTHKDSYLLFESNFNGSWHEYIEAFCQIINLDINALMACCEGFPGLVPARAFRTFMRNHEFTADHYYSAYPEASITLIRAAGELAGDLARLAKPAARGDDSAFAEAWYQLLSRPRVQANLAGQACTQPGLSAYLRRLFFAKKNMAGKTEVLVALTPIERGRADELREHLQLLPRHDRSPLAGVPGTHFGRWVVLDRVFHDSWSERFELLDPAYLLFSVVFDRTSRDGVTGYLDGLLSALGPEADLIWGACQDWPGTADRKAAISYLRDHRRDARFMLAGYPGDVATIRRTLANRELLVQFAKQAQTLPPEQLRAAFTATFAAVGEPATRGAAR
jgi:hypothetical protein